MTDIASIELWHKRARPEPTFDSFNVQLGCHFEEIFEMLAVLEGETGVSRNHLAEARMAMTKLAEGFKSGVMQAYVIDSVEFADSLADQVVTAVGTGYCNAVDMAGALGEVNTSNWSKFDSNGQPMFNEQGKIQKGPNYRPPQLESFV